MYNVHTVYQAGQKKHHFSKFSSNIKNQSVFMKNEQIGNQKRFLQVANCSLNPKISHLNNMVKNFSKFAETAIRHLKEFFVGTHLPAFFIFHQKLTNFCYIRTKFRKKLFFFLPILMCNQVFRKTSILQKLPEFSSKLNFKKIFLRCLYKWSHKSTSLSNVPPIFYSYPFMYNTVWNLETSLQFIKQLGIEKSCKHVSTKRDLQAVTFKENLSLLEY